MFLARCRFFVFVRLTSMRQRPVHPTLFVESYVTRSSSVHLSATSPGVRVPSATECQLLFVLVQ